jgi:PAS domain S-box-containing protein
MGIMTVGSAVICLYDHWLSRRKITPYQLLEYIALLLAIVAAAAFIYSPLLKYNQTLLIRPYFLFPLMVWGAIRFGTIGVVTVNLVIMTTGLIGAVNGVLPSGTGTVDDQMFIHQLLAMTIGIIGLVLSAAVREKEKSEKMLLKQSNRMKSIVDNVVDGIVTTNEDCKIEGWNAAAHAIFGYELSEVIEKDVNMLMTDAGQGAEDSEVSNHFRPGRPTPFDVGRKVMGKRKDGSVFPMDLAVSDFFEGKHRFFNGIIRDITDRETAAQELIAAKEAAETANIAKTAFLANMSHEIRTPLGVILGFADLVTDPAVDPSEKRGYVSAIQRNSELLSGIINDILDLSKIEAGKMELKPRSVNLQNLIFDTKPLLEFLAKEKGIGLGFEIESRVPNIIVTDPLRLRQILINIVGNAIKFTTRGRVDVRVFRTISPTGPDQLAFEVKDTGCGISKDEIQKLFSPFSQADVTLKRKFGGTGLGLYLSQRLAKLLGGDLVISESVPGIGSTFVIKTALTLPEQISNENVVSLKTDLRLVPQTRLNGMRVLLADDAVDNQFLISHVLRLAGAIVDIVSNGKEAVERTIGNPYDLILMDIQMPTMDGSEATTALRLRGYRGKIIALTAYALNEERERFLKNGFDDYISKPINRAMLIDRVASFQTRPAVRELHPSL